MKRPNAVVVAPKRNDDALVHHLANAPALSEEERQELHQLELESLAKSTRRSYESDLKMYTAWLQEHYPNITDPAQTTDTHMLLWLNSMKQRGLSLATLERRLAMMRRLIPTLKDADIANHYNAALAGLKNSMDTGAERGAKPLMYDDLVEAVSLINRSTNDGLQRVAVLLLGWSGAFRRSEINSLTNECVHYVPKGMLVKLLFKTKTGTGQSVCINAKRGNPMCPVAAIKEWQQRCGGAPTDRLFHHVTSTHDCITERPLQVERINQYVKDAAYSIGLEEGYTAHSLRVGFVSDHAQRGEVGVAAIMDQTRHRSLQTVQRYMKASSDRFNHGF